MLSSVGIPACKIAKQSNCLFALTRSLQARMPALPANGLHLIILPVLLHLVFLKKSMSGLVEAALSSLDQKTKSARPITRSAETVPHARLSALSSRLSPMTKSLLGGCV